MNFQFSGHVRIYRAQELQEFTAAMATMQFTDDFASSNVQRGEQGGGAVAHVVVITTLGNAGRERQYGLRTVQRLDLALLVDTQHHRLQWRFEVQTDDVANLVDKQRITREFEGFLPMRLQAESAPDARHSRLRKAHLPSHLTRTPVRRACRYGFQCLRDNGIDTGVVDRSGRTRTRRVEQAVQPMHHPRTCPKPFDGLHVCRPTPVHPSTG